jgi:flagellar protein FliO/FliZ
MPLKRMLAWLSLLWLPVNAAAALDPAQPKPVARVVSGTDVMAWGFGLLVVLAIFLLCIWVLRKIGGVIASGGEKLHLVGGLSLGMRERVVLLQVGKKQLLLGVTPGRIQSLLVLEGEDCLQKAESLSAATASGSAFAQKLAQAMKIKSDA